MHRYMYVSTLKKLEQIKTAQNKRLQKGCRDFHILLMIWLGITACFPNVFLINTVQSL